MSERNIIFSNIVSTPTLSSWAQAYNAGKLFAVLSLQGNLDLSGDDDQSLGATGKKILNSLEQEFFTLETKDLKSIKGAVEITIQKIPDDVKASFVITAIVNNIAYLFVLNKGRVNLKREDKIGTIIDGEKDQDKLKAASGFLKDKDIIILQTEQFTTLVSEDRLSSSLDHQPPSEISETLAPFVHEAEEGGAAAVIIEYKEEKGLFEEETAKEQEKGAETEEVIEEKEDENDNIEQPKYEEENFVEKSSFFYALKEKIRLPKMKIRVNHSKKIFLTIALVILVVLVSGIYFAYKNQQDNKVKAVFSQYYPDAEKKYEEGKALVDLNQSLARDSFLASQKTLNEVKDKLPKGSTEEKQVLDLLGKVNSSLSSTSGVSSSSAKEVGSSESSILSFENTHSGNYFFASDKNIYYIDDKGVNVNDGTTSKTIIKNNSTWKTPGGLGVYFGNIYVLDKNDGILKFASGSYAQSAYFIGTAPDLTKASSIAIDGSIWILFSNGNITKFTKGAVDNFSVSGLDIKFSNPSRIYTDLNINNVYVLDNGNSRIVVLGKDGKYKAQYQSGILKTAKDFDVQESAKKIFVLSGGKIYEIDLK